MAIYSFRCRSCGNYKESQSREIVPCSCGDLLRRVFSFSTRNDVPAHFNHSVGAYVSNMREFNDKLKEKSEEASNQFGVDVNYAPVDLSDRKSLKVTDEGLGATIDNRKKLNMAPLNLPKGSV